MRWLQVNGALRSAESVNTLDVLQHAAWLELARKKVAFIRHLTPPCSKVSAIEDGLYTPALKARFQQLEDQAERLRVRLQVSGRMLAPAKREAGRKWSELQTLIARLQANDTEYDVLQFKRMVGTINVIPGTARSTCRFSPA